MKNNIGLKYIASELGLSVAAVSRALKDYNDINEDTKRKVRQKAIEYGYIPKSLKKTDKKTVAILVDSLGSSFFGIIAEKMIEEFKKHNCLIHFISTAHNFVSKENIKEAIEFSSDGIISFLIPEEDAYEIALLYNMPILLFGRYAKKPKLNVVYMDDFYGGELAASYLVKQGANKLCYVGANGIECSLRREKGFINGGLNNGIQDIKVIYAADNIENLIKAGYNWYFCFDDGLANYILNLQKDKDIHVVGFNGISKYLPQFDFFASIYADYDLMIKDAVTILIDKINNQNEGEARIIKHTTKLC